MRLTPEQKDEIRRLTQLANRRIKAAERAYRKEGLDILPKEVVGRHQLRDQWATKASPLSRSVKFADEQEYRKHLKYLRSFERERPGIKEYNKVQQTKTIQAIESSLGVDISPKLLKKIEKMNAPQLAKFWKKFSDKASNLGVKYSSEGAMQQTIEETFPEDIENAQTTTTRKR